MIWGGVMGDTAKFLFTYVKCEVEKGHLVETDN